MIGAGPFGLSIAAWLGVRARVYGAPMQTWRTLMPPDMLMRSAWEETSLSAPSGGTIDEWSSDANEPRTEPLPLQMFLRYTNWFRDRFVADHDQDDVVSVTRDGSGYCVRTAEGGEARAAVVVVAVGVTPFPQTPPTFEGLVGGRVTHAIAQTTFDHLAGQRVAVIGGGQAALESAGLAGRAGAEVELLARSPVHWFADREPHHPRGPLQQRLYKLAYPAVGYGPPPLNRFVLHPDLFAALPSAARRKLTRRLLRPGGSPWLRQLVDEHATVTERVTVKRATEVGDGLRLELSDGTTRLVDTVILAAGYRFSLAQLGFFDDDLRGRIAVEDGWPVLDRWFRSSDPNLYFVGYPAEGRFGPLSRFVLGADFTARRVAASLARQTHSGSHGPGSSRSTPS